MAEGGISIEGAEQNKRSKAVEDAERELKSSLPRYQAVVAEEGFKIKPESAGKSAYVLLDGLMAGLVRRTIPTKDRTKAKGVYWEGHDRETGYGLSVKLPLSGLEIICTNPVQAKYYRILGGEVGLGHDLVGRLGDPKLPSNIEDVLRDIDPDLLKRAQDRIKPQD